MKKSHEEMVKIAEAVYKKIGYTELQSNTLAERATIWIESGRDPRNEAEREIIKNFK